MPFARARIQAYTPSFSCLSRIAAAVVIAACASGAYTLSAAALPDGRAYEQVSPAQKSGGVGGILPLGSLVESVEQLGRPLQSSLDGSGVTYLGEDFYKPQLGSLDQYLSQRGSTGWSTQNLTPGVLSPTELPIEANQTVGVSPELSTSVIGTPTQFSKGAPAGYQNLYQMRSGVLQPLVTVKPHREPAEFGYAFVRGLSRQPGIMEYLLFAGGNFGTPTVEAFSHLLFEANDALTEDAVDGGRYQNNLYDWVNGRLRLVNVLPNGKPEPNATFGMTYYDRYENRPIPSVGNVISADGGRIFWTDLNTEVTVENPTGETRLFVRENDASPNPTTVQMDASLGGGGVYQTASTDGSKVLFTKSRHLYEYDTATEAVRDLTEGGGVEGVLGASSDGSYVYFVSSKVLGAGAEEGQPNLYLSRAGALSFIATLALADDEGPELYGTGSGPTGDWYRTYAGRTAEVSPSGRYVAFMSLKELTGYGNPERDYEIYVYDAGAKTLACASCRVDGGAPTARSLLPYPAGGIYQQRYLDDSGRLFFSTAEAVLPEDTNGMSDVYEYEGGHVYLISPGKTPDEAVFADASEGGDDVFFTTHEPLVPGDADQIIDLYDARVGGVPEASPSGACAEEASCRENAVSPPSAGAPVSSIFLGLGNIASHPAGPSTQEPKRLTRAQKLSRALKLCRAKKDRHKRKSCETRSRRRY